MNKKIFLGLCLTLFTAYHLAGQTKEVIVNKGDTLSKLLSTDYVYWLPRFAEGTVFFKSKEVGKGLLNYSFLAKRMQFVENPENSKLDASAVNVSEIKDLVITNVKFITIGDLLFVNTNKGIMLQLTDFPINLLKKVEVTLSDNAPKGAYGIPVSTGSASTPSSLSDLPSNNSMGNSSESRSSNVNNMGKSGNEVRSFGENRQYRKSTKFYLTENSKVILINNEKTFFKLFPSKVQEIKTYIEKENIDFYSEESLIALTKYCNSLK